MTSEHACYWDEVVEGWKGKRRDALWRAHSDAVNAALLARWLPPRPLRLLKTDLFDEAVSDGLYPLLASRAASVTGIDVSPLTVRAARERYPDLDAMPADVRDLPFADGEFDVIVSNSTLDHLDSLAELRAGVAELHRVLAPGGDLLITLDNGANPIVALRNLLPFAVLRRLGIVPYYVGVTCGGRRFRGILSERGFEVREQTVIMHCPRVLAVAAARLLERHAGLAAQRRHLRWLLRFERLARWPTRSLTGYFVAARAVKP